MPKNKEIGEFNPERKRLFKSSSKKIADENGFELSTKQDALEINKKSDIDNSEITPRRVSDLLNSFSKFDEDIMRLQGIGNVISESDNDPINKLSIDKMQEELKQFLLQRDKIKTNLDNLIIQVTETSNELEAEEEKIIKFKKEIQLQTEKQSTNLESE
jgi:hypothetical protein